jgi:hypothetical protein
MGYFCIKYSCDRAIPLLFNQISIGDVFTPILGASPAALQISILIFRFCIDFWPNSIYYRVVYKLSE